MRASTAIHLLPLLLLFLAGPARADDETIEVRIGQDVAGIDQVFRRCFAQLREAGHDPERMPASEIGVCMRPEIEAMAEFAYAVSTAYSVSSLTRLALETCTLEQANALAPRRQQEAERQREKLSWRWLTDCLKEVRWLEHDQQAERLRRARSEAEKLNAN
jgi:hypothetical protein